jgi:hypothetical protein
MGTPVIVTDSSESQRATPAKPASRIKPPSQFWQGLLTLLFLTTLVWTGLRAGSAQAALLWSFGLLTAYCALLGQWILKDPLGILINDRNLMSLSRLQTALWTIVIFSGFLTIVLQRIHAGVDKFPDALNVTVDPRVWAVMGISLGSLIGTPMILNSKKDQQPSDKALQSAGKSLDELPSEIAQNGQGTLYSNPSPRDAAITDIFQGDEIGNAVNIDVAKLQMFLFTIALVVAYAAQLYASLSAANGHLPALNAMPELSSNAITLLGISHAGYLTSKAVDHTSTAAGQD